MSNRIFELLNSKTDSGIDTEIISPPYNTLKKDDKLFIKKIITPTQEWFAQVVSFDEHEHRLRFNVISYAHEWDKFVPETEPKIRELKLNKNYIITKIMPKGHLISKIMEFGGDTIKRKTIKRKTIKPRNPNSLGGPTYKY